MMRIDKVVLLLAFLGLRAFAVDLVGGPRASHESIYFEPNLGQFPPEVRFLARGTGAWTWITADSLTIQGKDGAPVKVQFGRNPSSEATGIGQLPGVSHYFHGNDPQKWIRSVPSFAKVKIANVYEGIDVLIYARQGGGIEYDFVIKPGADPTQITLRFENPYKAPVFRANGDVTLETPWGSIQHGETVIVQDGKKIPFRTRSQGNQLAFAIGPYDASQPLTLDPSVVYSTYIGGTLDDSVKGMAVDASGATYITGQTASPDFPNANFTPIGRLRGATEAFVTKYATVSGTYQRVSSTYIGGSDRDSGDAIAIDSQGAAYVTGTTRSPDFPSVAALQTSIGSGDETFVLKISPAGTGLVYSTFFGGSGNESVSSIAVDTTGAAYIAGSTDSTNLNVLNAPFPAFSGGLDGFLLKIAATPTGGIYPAVYATYFGGSAADYAYGVAVDASGSAHIVGTSRSPNLPALAAFQPTPGDTNGGGDGYIARFSATPGAGGIYGLVYSSFLGGSEYDAITSIAIDAQGNAHLAGRTTSPNFPIRNSLSTTGFTFVAKIGAQPTGSPAIYQPIYTSLYAGQTQSLAGIAVDSTGAVHVAGQAYYSQITGHIPLVDNMVLPASGGVFGFLFKLSAVSTGTPSILYSSYLESGNLVLPAAIGVDASGIAYVASNHGAGAPIVGGGSPAVGAFGNGNIYLQRIAPTGGPNVSIDSLTLGAKFTVAGAGCNPGEYTVPRTFTWAPGIDCVVTFTTPFGGESFGPPQYRFASWDNPTTNTNPTRTIRATSTATTYRGIFDEYYGVQASISPPGSGSTTPDLPCCPSATYFKGGSSLTITANPRPGYLFVTWTGNTDGMANPNNPVQTLTINSWRGLVANFRVDPAASISFVSNGPTVTFTASGTGCGETFYEVPVSVAWREGTSCTVTTFARLGGENIQFQPTMPQYRFVNWDDGITSLTRVIAGSNTAKTYRLNFDTFIPIIAAIGGPANGGTINPPTGYQKQGTTVTYTATANVGFRFTGWSGVAVSNPASPSISIPIGTAATITANFVATTTTGTVPITFTSSVPGIPVRGENCGGDFVTPAVRNLVPGSECVLEYAGSHFGPLGTGAAYQFLRWEDGREAAFRVITVPGVATTYNVLYKTFYSVFGLARGDVGSGLVTPNERSYEPGQTATLTATANTGYVFTGWTGTIAIANPNQNTISFVVNRSETVIANFAKVGAPAVSGVRFAIGGSPCRLVDTRNPDGPLGGPALAAKTVREFPLGFANCSFNNAEAYLLNITVVPRGPLGYLSIWPTGQAQPLVSTLNSLDGRVKANAAIVPAGPGGSVSVYATDTTDVIIDLMGIVTNALSNGMAFYPLPPCRISDSRVANGPLGGPFLAATSTRTIPVRSSACNIPNTATAYSLNATVIPKRTLGFLTLFPTGTARPNTSVLNALTGTVVANAAFVGVGQQGAIDAYVTEDADLVLDINGYFAPPGSPGELYFYPVPPCRISDTRLANGPFGGPAQGGQATREYAVPASACGIPATAKAYSVNATVVPPGLFGYLTLWPVGTARPTVSTLNAIDGAITSNAAIVPAGNGGAVAAFGSELFHLLIDINGYFAP